MSEISATNYTEQLKETKEKLDRSFHIIVKEDAMRIISEMKDCLKDEKIWTRLGDLQDDLIKILEDVPEYVQKYSEDGYTIPKGLISSFRYEGDNKKVIDEAIKEYEKYVRKIKSISEVNKNIDIEFIAKLNSVYDEYKSSTDYMTRLVNRLLKYNIGCTDEKNAQTETRVLILKRFLNSFGYDCVKDISSPELEDIVKNEFEGKIENITDNIFRYLNWDEKESAYDKDYIDALVELQGTVLYKSSMIKMTKELCEELCDLICDEIKVPVKNRKTKVVEDINKRILTDSAMDGTATLLKDCFYEPESFAINYIRNYADAEIDKIVTFIRKLNQLYTKGKKEELKSFSNIDESIRLGILFEKFGEKINASKEILALFSNSFSNITLQNGNTLGDCLNEAGLKKIKCLKQSNITKEKENFGNIRKLLNKCEELLNKEDRKQYQVLLYKKIGERYNGATNPSKKDSLYKKANELLNIEITEYKLLKIADDLANAKFSSQGKTREYLYIFAIAFNIWEIENGHPNRIVDLEKNLFWDYYADNIVNNLQNVAGLGEKSDALIDGYGINYKNFAEVIFLWSLEQKNMTEKEKLQTAYEMIRYCIKNGKTEKEFSEKELYSNNFKTEVYKNGYTAFKTLPKEKFREYILEHYPCKSTNSGSIEINNEPRTAKEVIASQEKDVNILMAKVEENLLFEETEDDLLIYFEGDSVFAYFFNKYQYLIQNRCKNCIKKSTAAFPDCTKYFDSFCWTDGNGKERFIESCDDFYQEFVEGKTDDEIYELMSDNIHKALTQFLPSKQHFEKGFSKVNELCPEEYKSLKYLLNRIKTRLQAEFDEDEAKLHFKKASRSSIIALCFYEIVLINWLKRLSDENTIFGSFEKFYDIFCEGNTFLIKMDYEGDELIDTDNVKEEISDDNKNTLITIKYLGANNLLEEGGYQKINYKNIFDIYTIYSAYRDNFSPIYSSQGKAFIDYYQNSYEKFKFLEKERSDY